ncbi:tRNA (adenosine(37)-N6)-threonylcarbamoyltransferase complex transferase subunit TsaD [Candidatus Gracilibacteria bacterium]|nr:tRNA (adenosine(37)-N6)-threonylcarbamoyltransferase complex transferase subunit TsaD [Candidatus Gracilibacteria bacterium]
MYILAFETSCDDTSVAVMQDDVCVALSTRTQLEHDVTGGVVPEVAARSHANAIFPCIDDALAEADITINQIDLIACTDRPGLAPSLLTGLVVADTLALSTGKPILKIDHIESHIFANFLERTESDIIFPAVVLTVSGGHTELYLWKSIFDLEMIGQTHDDAAGECFDKVAKMMGLGFPGGKKIADLAARYTGSFQGIFPLVLLEKDSLDFSFSGLKSAVKRYIDVQIATPEGLTEEKMMQIAFEFEQIVTDILSKKIQRAVEHKGAHMMILAGGVSANSTLKNKIQKISETIQIPFLSPKRPIYSMDNAAMVGIRAYYQYQKNI